VRCAACGALRELAALPETRGFAGEVELELHGLKGRVCPQGHAPAHFTTPGFDADLLSALLLEPALPAVRQRGWIAKRLACTRCGARVAAEPRASGELRCRVWVEKAAPCVAVYRGPVLRCEGCRTDQLPPMPGVEPSLRSALLDALRRAELVPPTG